MQAEFYFVWHCGFLPIHFRKTFKWSIGLGFRFGYYHRKRYFNNKTCKKISTFRQRQIMDKKRRKQQFIWRHYHRIDTRPEGTLLCVLAEGKRPKFFYVLWRHPGVHTALCTYVFLWKTSVCTPGWRHMMAYFHVSTRKISDKISSEWHFWSCIYSVSLWSMGSFDGAEICELVGLFILLIT